MAEPTAPTDARWQSRPVIALALQLLIIALPVVIASGLARLLLGLLPAGVGWPARVAVLALGGVLALGLGRLGSRLLPLVVLLKMTMIFPDQAPSRAKVARRATSKSELMEKLAHPNADVRDTAATLLALVAALGRHDRKTRGHSERVRLYCDLIGTELRLDDGDRGRLRWAGLLHDIGKLEVAAEILNKPSKLNDHEWDAVRQHPHSGAQLAEPLAGWLGEWYHGIAHHHEKFDGSGYPAGLAGEQISRAGRIVSVVDAFETMTAARSYKSPMTTAAARAELTRCAGSHFDPAVVRAFLGISLPRLLWSMGPLTFLINFPFLRWIPAGSARVADAAAVSANAATTAVGATAVTVAVVASPVAGHAVAAHSHAADRLAAANYSAQPAGISWPNGSTTGYSPAAPASPSAAAGTSSSSAPAAGSTAPARASASPSASGTGNADAPSDSSSPESPVPSPTEPGANGSGSGAAPSKTPPAKNPPTKTPPAKNPPAKNPPSKTPPSKTPPAKTPPSKNPPTKTAPSKTPPSKAAPKPAPPAKVAPPPAKKAAPGKGRPHG